MTAAVDPLTNTQVYPRGKSVGGRLCAMQVQSVVFSPVLPQNRATDLSAVVALSPPVGANVLRFQVLSQNARTTTTNGYANALPAAAQGFQIQAGGSPVEIFVETGDTINFIEETAGAILEYQWGRSV